jgi:hypothetical protein
MKSFDIYKHQSIDHSDYKCWTNFARYIRQTNIAQLSGKRGQEYNLQFDECAIIELSNFDCDFVIQNCLDNDFGRNFVKFNSDEGFLMWKLKFQYYSDEDEQ